jgi:hypothetical protein
VPNQTAKTINVKSEMKSTIGTRNTDISAIIFLLAGVFPHAIGRTAEPQNRLHNLKNRAACKKMQPE